MDTHSTSVIETLLISTHNIVFGREIMESRCHHSLSSGALIC